jgi:putative Holliday junction resolvase
MGRIMALDVGDKMVGVAVSDEMGLLAEPRPPLVRSSIARDVGTLRGLVQEWAVERIVVGLPLNMNGTEGPQATRTRAFAQAVAEATGLPMEFWDERLSTREAERRLVERDVRRGARRGRVDGFAAAIILQGYLDRRRSTGERRDTVSDKDINHPDVYQGDDDEELITLTDEDGEDHEFVVVDVIEVSAKEYAILLPYDTADDEEAEAVILRIEKGNDGEDQLVEIEDETEWQSVVDAYEAVLEEDGDGE